MLFKVVFGDLEGKTFSIAQPWWPIFKKSFGVIFIKKTDESLLKS